MTKYSVDLVKSLMKLKKLLFLDSNLTLLGNLKLAFYYRLRECWWCTLCVVIYRETAIDLLEVVTNPTIIFSLLDECWSLRWTTPPPKQLRKKILIRLGDILLNKVVSGSCCNFVNLWCHSGPLFHFSISYFEGRMSAFGHVKSFTIFGSTFAKFISITDKKPNN